MTPQTAKNIFALLERVTLSGKEVQAWCEAVTAITELLAQKDPPAVPPAA